MGELDQQAQRGQQAERILADEIFTGAIAKVEQRYLDDWRTSHPEEVAKREKAYLMLRALGDVLKELRVVIAGGQVAAATMQRAQRRG